MAAAQKKNIYTAAEVAVLENTIQEQQAQIEELKRKLEHMNEVFANAQRARFGQSSEKAAYVLGADQISIFDEMTMRYFNKIYPTLMSIQVSNDASNWYDISELTSAHNDPTHPVVTESYDVPYAARYIRLFFEELNSAAAGNGVGLAEWEITGIALSDVSLKSVPKMADITKNLNEELTAAELPQFVKVVLTQKVAGALEVVVPVTWDLTSYDASQNGVCQIVGTLNLPASVDASDNTVTVQVTVGTGEAPAENPFTDVPEGVFYTDPVLWAVENGITTGATETTFNPDGNCQRAQVVTFLWRASGSPAPKTTNNPLTDVSENDFFYDAVLWAVEESITNGLSKTQFGPYTECNRAQVVTFLYRSQGEPAYTNTTNPFSDVTVTDFYGPAVLWAVENKITEGMGNGTFGVNAICNRAQVVTFLYRTLVK